jgi:hypothetical protein
LSPERNLMFGRDYQTEAGGTDSVDDPRIAYCYLRHHWFPYR